MSDRKKIKTEGRGSKRGSRQRNNFRNKNQPNNNTESHNRKLEELETATYIVSQLSLSNRYERVTKEVIRYVIRNLPGGVHLVHGMRNSKLPSMLMDTKPKQEKNTDGTSAVDKDEYKLQVLKWKENEKIQIKRKRHVNERTHNLYAIIINKSSPEMRSKLDVTTGHEQVEAYQDGITLLAMIKNIIYGVEESLQYTMAILMAKKTLHMSKNK